MGERGQEIDAYLLDNRNFSYMIKYLIFLNHRKKVLKFQEIHFK